MSLAHKAYETAIDKLPEHDRFTNRFRHGEQRVYMASGGTRYTAVDKCRLLGRETLR